MRVSLLGLLVASCLGSVSSACIDREPFACEEDEQCEGPGVEGHCAAPGFCAHPDTSCDSGSRFGRFASAELAERCTDVQESSGSDASGSSSSDGSESGPAGSSSSSGDSLPVEECDGVDNDGDGLIDEWSEVNARCNECDLYQRQGSVYWRCNSGRWTDAQPVCESFGANLASVQSAEENLFLALRTESGANWIGLNDIGNEGGYSWVDGERLRYTNWLGGAPPANDPESNCGAITTQGEWAIFNCSNSRRGFCEAEHP